MTNCKKSFSQRILGLTMALVMVLSVFSVVPVASGIVSVAESADTATQVTYKSNDNGNPYQEWYFETAGEAYSGIAYTPAAKDSYAKWKAEQVGDFYRFVNQGNNKALAQNGTTVNLVASSDNDDYQLWEVRKSENFTGFGGFTITVYNFLNKATGEVLRSDASYLGRHPYLTTMPNVAFWSAAEVMTSFADTNGDTVDLATGTELLIRIGHPTHTNYFTAITNYKIRNRVSEKLLTVKDDTLETYATQMTDASQLWQLRPTLSSQSDYLNLYNVESGNFVGFNGTNILWNEHAMSGEALMTLNGDTSIKAPQENVAYRIKPIDWKGNKSLSEYNPDYDPKSALDTPITVDYETTETGFDAQIWKFIRVSDNVPGMYYIQNKASGNYLTVDNTEKYPLVKTCAFEPLDYRQIWMVEDPATGDTSVNDNYICIYNFGSWNYIYYWSDKVPYCDGSEGGSYNGSTGTDKGVSCFQLNGIKQTPVSGEYYRISTYPPVSEGIKYNLTEAGHTYTPVDSSVNYIESAPARNHISSNWILKQHNYKGETVYTIKNKDLGLVIDNGWGLSYEEPGEYKQYWRFVETSANTYEIQNVFTNAIMVWAGGTGATPGTTLSGAGLGSGYTWQLIGETGSVSVCEGTFMLRGQGGTMRATGGTPYTLDVQDKATASYEARELGQSAQLWSFEEDETVTGAYRVINKASGKYLTLEETDFFTTETLSNDGRQLWKLEASPISGYESSNINLINVASGAVICANQDGLITKDAHNLRGESLMSLSGKFNIAPDMGEYYRIDLVGWYQKDGKELSLTEAGHEALEPVDNNTFYVGSASSMPHTSINWIVKEHKFNGETVYTLQSEDTGLFLTWGNAKSGQMGLDYEYGNEARQFFKFEDLGNNSYYIRAVGNGDPYLIWEGINGRPYGKGVSFGDPNTMDCSWQLNSGTAAVGEGTFTFSCQGGTLRAIGGSEYNPETPVDIKTIYVSNDGNDENDGLTEATAIKSIDRLNQMNILAGTEVLFRKGDTFVGQVMINSVIGTTDNPVKLGNYGTLSANPKIQAPEIENGVLSESVKYAKARPNDSTIYSAIRITYSENIQISGIDLYSTNDGETYYSHISNPNALLYADNSVGLKIENMNLEAAVENRHKEYNCDVTGESDIHKDLTISYPYQGNDYYGFLITHSYNPENTSKSNVVIKNVSISHVTANAVNAGQFMMSNVECVDSPAWGFTFTNAYDGYVTDCKTDNTGYGYNYNGSAAFMTTSSHNIIFNNLLIENAHRNEAQTWDGVGFDFEGGKNQNNIVLQNSIIRNTDGSAIMIFDNSDGNKQIKIINVFVQNANIAETDEGAINLYPNKNTPDTYTNTVDFTGVSIVQNGSLPFYTGYSNNKQELLAYKGVTFTDCIFASTVNDINGDGEEDVNDIIEIRKRLLTGYGYTFDINGDNVVNLLDLVRLKKNIAEIA